MQQLRKVGLYSDVEASTFRTDDPPLADEIDHRIPTEFKIFPVYPNPFNPETKVSFSVSHPAEVSISVYNVNGRLIRALFNQKVKEGEHSFTWDASDLSSGVYIMRLSSENFLSISKCTLIK